MFRFRFPTPYRIAVVAGALAALWLVLLVVLDGALAGREAARITTRVGESLQGSASVGAVDLALVRGRLAIDELAVHRDDAIGRLVLAVPEARCELAPLGGALVDRGCRELAVRGVRLEASTPAVFQLHHPKRPPLHASHVAIDDAVLAFEPSAFLPELGRVAIAIDHAEAGATVLRTPLSWLFALQVLRASIELPAGITLRLEYADGMLAAAGALLGASPVVIALELPDPAAFADARDETRALVQLGEDVAERLVAARAAQWLRARL